MVVALRPVVLKLFRITVKNREIVPYDKPALIVGNHVALLDPIWIYSAARGPCHFVTTEDMFRRPFWARLLHWYGSFPKRKATQDFSSVKNMIRLLRGGHKVCLFPEGMRTWDGRLCELVPGIVTLIQRMKVPVIACRQEGSYLAHPRWARHMRRFPVTLTFEKVYDVNEIPEDPARVTRDLEKVLQYDDYAIEVDETRYRKSGLARDVTKLLYRCPNCRTYEGLKVQRPFSSNRIECASCFSSWRITVSNRLIPLDEAGAPLPDRMPLWQAYEKIRNLPLTPFDLSSPLDLNEGETVYMVSRRHVLNREERFPHIRRISVGRLYLTNRRLVFRNRHRLVLDAPLQKLRGISTEAGNRFNFVFEGRVYNVTMRTESLLKWFDTMRLLRDDPDSASPEIET
jgi:1-acyl-sn-glycerol-3-phosphate acyltransferase